MNHDLTDLTNNDLIAAYNSSTTYKPRRKLIGREMLRRVELGAMTVGLMCKTFQDFEDKD